MIEERWETSELEIREIKNLYHRQLINTGIIHNKLIVCYGCQRTLCPHRSLSDPTPKKMLDAIGVVVQEQGLDKTLVNKPKYKDGV